MQCLHGSQCAGLDCTLYSPQFFLLFFPVVGARVGPIIRRAALRRVVINKLDYFVDGSISSCGAWIACATMYTHTGEKNSVELARSRLWTRRDLTHAALHIDDVD